MYRLYRPSARDLWLGVFLVLAVACSSATGQRRATRQQGIITTQEIDAARYRSAFVVVEALRPLWVRPRGRTSFRARESVKVYLDDSLLGEPDQLKQITTNSIASIRFVDSNEATMRWGLDHGHGAIVVSTRRESSARP